MRIVVDTNVVVSALLFGGVPLRVLRAGEAGIVDLYTSRVLIEELADVIERPHFDRKFSETKISRRRLISDYMAIVNVVDPQSLSHNVSRDPDDDEVVACALATECEFIVTGDQDLLVLKEYQRIFILNPSEFLTEIGL